MYISASVIRLDDERSAEIATALADPLQLSTAVDDVSGHFISGWVAYTALVEVCNGRCTPLFRRRIAFMVRLLPPPIAKQLSTDTDRSIRMKINRNNQPWYMVYPRIETLELKWVYCEHKIKTEEEQYQHKQHWDTYKIVIISSSYYLLIIQQIIVEEYDSLHYVIILFRDWYWSDLEVH